MSKKNKKDEYVNIQGFEQSILWFEQSLGPEQLAKVEKLCKKLGLELVTGVKPPHVMTIERGR